MNFLKKLFNRHKHDWIYLETDKAYGIFLDEKYTKSVCELRYCKSCHKFAKHYYDKTWIGLIKEEEIIAINHYVDVLKPYLTEKQKEKIKDKDNVTDNNNDVKYLYYAKVYFQHKKFFYICCANNAESALVTMKGNEHSIDIKSFKKLGIADKEIIQDWTSIIISEMLY